MNDLVSAAVAVQTALQTGGWRFCLIGGLAVARWGEPRATQDVDFSVFVDFGREREFVSALLQEFAPMFPESETLALQCRVLPVDVQGIKADLSIACFTFEEEIINRATAFEFEPGATLVTISAEDLVVMKALAGRSTDWRDIAGITHRQTGALDKSAILERAAELSDISSEPNYLDHLKRILDHPVDHL